MMLSPMLRTGLRIAATVGGGAVGFYAMSGSRKERYLQSVIGMAVGYVGSGAALSMVPDTTTSAVAPTP